jgi:cytochrome oxidase Cu insertion factor (SCO1/SenC/PrrC family)
MNAPDPTDTAPSPATRRRWTVPAAVVAIAVALAAGVLVAHHRATTSTISSQGGGVALAKVGAPAPNGTFTTANGTQQTIASLRGHTTLVWLVAGGCASCAASIPTVTQHLAQLQAKGVQVVTLGLYGAFDNGKAGAAQLTAFGQAAAGTNVTRPGWTWAMPSEALSFAFDPSGNPDEYFLVNPDGYITYHNSVPVSTMPQLLAAAGTIPAHTTAAVSPAAAGGTTGTLPCPWPCP